MIDASLCPFGIPIIKRSTNFSIRTSKSPAVKLFLGYSNGYAVPPDSLLSDSLTVDSLFQDSLSIDSTARLKYFKYSRTDKINTDLKPHRRSAFFVYPSEKDFKREIKLDSARQFVIITESIAGIQIKPELRIPIDDYIQMRLDMIVNQTWEDVARAYEIKTGRTDLSDILSDITNIEIPLPSASFLSIFGPQVISLRISGAVDIHGAWRNETTEGVTASALGNTRNEPDFKQQVQINVSGTIGDKLTIGADWNTERTFEYENQLKIKYTGYEDEIIQSIEAGNVSLQTSPLVGGSEALFGIKAKFQMGPFSLTAIASQKKSEVQEVSVSGGSESQEFELHAYEYSPNHFFLDEIYADTSEALNLFNKYYGNPVPLVIENLRVKDLEVWKSITGLPDPNERKGNAFIDLPNRTKDMTTFYDTYRDSTLETTPGKKEIGLRFVKLIDGSDYDLHPETGFITFRSQIQDQEAIAVAYRIEGDTNSPDDDLYYGEFVQDMPDDSTVIVLKLVKPPNLQPGGDFQAAWKLQLKNIYSIGGRDVKEEGFKFDIKFVVDGQDPVNELNGQKLLTMFGLDLTNADGTSAQPDGEFDYFPGRTIFPTTGEIVFPVLQPFGKNSPLPDTLRYQAVYDTTVTFAKQDRTKDKFLLGGEYSASVSSTFSIGFNAVENSAKVYLGDRELKEGSDYRVDYNIGQITILNDAALVPGANLRITYEQNDLFQLASKTLLGLRGMYEFSKNTSLGFSFLNLNQQTLSDKVRIGEEPLKNSIFGVDFKTNVELPFLTDGLDYIFSTKAMSSINLRGEFAYINPDPNTKKSIIAGDGGQSIAYIDDFEGAKKIIPIGIAYGGWKDLSVPDDLPQFRQIEKMQMMNYKAKSYWFNMLPSDVTVRDIWGDRKQVSREDQTVTVLDYDYRPSVRGPFNYNPDWDGESDSLYKNWGGMMKVLSSTASNLIEENIEFIEFWIQIREAPPNAKLHIDLGKISEDVIPNKRLNTEDKNNNFLVDEGEDVGLDMMTNSEERIQYPDVDPADPSGDNFKFDGDRRVAETYVNINNTEGNARLTDIGRLPDSEDLNGNVTLDRVNSYFRYEVPLDTSRLTNPYIAGGGENNGWYQIKIPLNEFDPNATVGNPSFSVIEFMRLWISDVSEEIHVRLAELNLVGNQWQKVLLPGYVDDDDTVMTISTINVEDNPDYIPPAEGLRERDRSKPDEEVYKNEQSLELQIKKMEPGEKREAVKYLFRPLDLFNYREMKLFVHGDPDESLGSVSYYQSPQEHAADIYIRFGSDTLNYYEYRQPIQSNWHDMSITFSELTAIKQIRDDPAKVFTIPVKGRPGHTYGVRGNPSLTKVTFFIIGIENSYSNLPEVDFQQTGIKISGNIWVNELRVLGADDSPGWAYSAASTFQMADIMTVNVNASQTNPYFHKLADRFGSRVDKRSWGISSDLDLIKLIPVNLSGSSLKINYSHNESIAQPLYLPGTDIKVDEAAEQLVTKRTNNGIPLADAQKEADQMKSDAQTVSVSDTWTMSNIQLKIPTNKWYIRDTFNQLKFNFNYNKRFGRTPTTLKNSSWVWNAGLNYSVNFSKDLFFYPANIPIIGAVIQLFTDFRNAKVYFTPQNLSFGVTANRKFSFTENRNTTTEPNIQRDFTSKRNFGFLWKLTDAGLLNITLNYKADFSSSLTYLLLDNLDQERNEGSIWNDIFSGHFFGRDFNFRQQVDLKLNPKLPSLWDFNKYFSISSKYSVSYNWQNNFQQEEVGRSAGFSNNMSAGITLKWKSLTAPLFKETPADKATPGTPKRGGRRGAGRDLDSELNNDNPSKSGREKGSPNSQPADSVAAPKAPIYVRAYAFLKSLVQWTLFDYDQFAINFSQTNTQTGSGLKGNGTGFKNFWGVTNTFMEGPNRAFMLGLSYEIGPRAPNGNLSDNFSQKNNVDFKTSRPLWENATIDINWKVGWGVNKTTTITTDEYGNVTINNLVSTGSADRTFLTLPGFLGIDKGITQVNAIYQEMNPDEGEANRKLSEAFTEGFETLPFLSKLPLLAQFASYVPRPNWRINWSGLEKIALFKGFAKRVSLSHAYTSSYTQGWKINVDGFQEVQTQKISYGFAPLVGMNLTFDDFLGGNLTGSFKYNSKTSYDLGVSTRNITQTASKDINVTASYSKSGFEIPLFGVALKNDIEISLSYTSGKNSVVIFEMDNFKEEGKPQDGTNRVTIEPRIKYVMSQRVTLSLFYKRTTVEPIGASRIPPTTTNEAGLDVHISIQ